MFSLKDFVKQGFLCAVGKMADYQIILNAAGWLEKGVLDENDLAEIQGAINDQYVANESTDEPMDEMEDVLVETPIEEEVIDVMVDEVPEVAPEQNEAEE